MTIHKVDLTLQRDLRKFGAFDVDACFNCGNCTAVCQHSDDTASFPRRLIRYGQLGMRDRLLATKEPWLCWNCRDCSDTCPRQARPSEYMEAVRRYTIASVDPTGISRLMYTSTPFMLGFTVFLAVMFAGVLLSRTGTPESGRFDLFGFIPFELIHDLGLAVMVLVGVVSLINVVRLVNHLSKTMGPAGAEGDGGPARGLAGRVGSAVGAVLAEMANQKRFRICELDAVRPLVLRQWFLHYAIMWGFIGLGLATVFDFLFKAPGMAVPLWYPSRLVGTIAGLALVYGTTVTIIRRLRAQDPTQARMVPADWLFLSLLFVVGLTGFVIEAADYIPGFSGPGYVFSVVHVALAMELIILLPFYKFAHAIFRPLAYGIYRFKTDKASAAQTQGLAEAG